jgi:hypothetical protein
MQTRSRPKGVVVVQQLHLCHSKAAVLILIRIGCCKLALWTWDSRVGSLGKLKNKR